MRSNLDGLTINHLSTILEAAARMDIVRAGIILVVDDGNRLLGTVTDGDVRRAHLANMGFEQPITAVLDQKSDSPYAKPITAYVGTDKSTLLGILRQHRIRHLPILDEFERLVGMVTLDQFIPHEPIGLQALVMAGGLGSRMRPLTDALPKPMLPVGDKPLMEIIVHQLQIAGIERINVAVHHASEQIIQHFGDGSDFGVSINYVTEGQPLGTAGALGLMELPNETTLVINGDILTRVDFRAMLEFHREYRADMTAAVQRNSIELPYGVVECEGTVVNSITEKPTMNFLLNAGIYLLEPEVYNFVSAGQRIEMTDLIQTLVAAGRSVHAFPILEAWIDIGSPSEYQRAQDVAKDLGIN